jgi:hypothetical protein
MYNQNNSEILTQKEADQLITPTTLSEASTPLVGGINWQDEEKELFDIQNKTREILFGLLDNFSQRNSFSES